MRARDEREGEGERMGRGGPGEETKPNQSRTTDNQYQTKAKSMPNQGSAKAKPIRNQC